MGEKACLFFSGSREGTWHISYEDGTCIEQDHFVIPCSLVGYIEMKCQTPQEDGEKSIEEKWQYCNWHFDKNRYCPIEIDGKWGFIDCFFNIPSK